MVSGNVLLAEEIAATAVLIPVAPGTAIIEQDGADNDLYLILAGSFDILVNARKIARRVPNDHVGEMAAIRPAQRRSAGVVAVEEGVVCKLTEPQLTELGQKHPDIWRFFAEGIGAPAGAT